MRTKHSLLRFPAILFGIFFALCSPALPSHWGRVTVPDTLVILHVNDSHSHLLPFGPKNANGVPTVGGLARVATLVKQTRAHEKNVLFFHAGDLFVGDFMWDRYHGVPEFKILHQLGCDAFTIGNHEFEIGPEVLKASLKKAGLPAPDFAVLSANIDMSQDPGLDSLVVPYIVKKVGHLKVGIFGLTTPESNDFQHPKPDSVIGFIQPARACVDSLRSKVDLIIALTHLGVYADSVLADSVAGIDLIVGGHSHTKISQPIALTNPEGKITYIVQAKSKYRYLGKLKAYVDGSGMHILSYALIPVNASVPNDPEIGAEIDTLKNLIENDPRYGRVYSETIAQADTFLSRESGWGYKDTPIGNLITDAYRAKTGTDIAIDVYGYISQDLWQGPLTGMDLFQIAYYGYNPATGLGFDLWTFNLKGYELKMGLEYVADKMGSTKDLTVQVSGMSFKYNPTKPPMLKVSDIKIGGEPYSITKTYSITSNYGLYSFLGVTGLQNAKGQDTGIPEYVAIRDYARAHSPLHPRVEGRIENTFETRVSPRTIRQAVRTFQLFQSYPNPVQVKNGPSGGVLISFQLLRREQVTLAVYNALGQEIKRLFSGNRAAGTHKIVWDGRDDAGHLLPEGIYFYKLTAGSVQKTRKLILMRR